MMSRAGVAAKVQVPLSLLLGNPGNTVNTAFPGFLFFGVSEK